MKNPHIRTLPSHRPLLSYRDFFDAHQYGKRLKKAARLWLRGEGPQPEKFPMEIGHIEAFRFLTAPFIK